MDKTTEKVSAVNIDKRCFLTESGLTFFVFKGDKLPVVGDVKTFGVYPYTTPENKLKNYAKFEGENKIEDTQEKQKAIRRAVSVNAVFRNVDTKTLLTRDLNDLLDKAEEVEKWLAR